VRAAQVQLDYCTVRAPFTGVVIAKAAQVGEIISPLSAGGGFTRTGIGTLVDMDSLEVEVDVNEAYINRVEPGQRVESVLNAYPDWRIPSHVIAIIPTADRSKATVKVRVGLDVKARADIIDHVRQLVTEQGIGVLWATHLFDEITSGDDLLVLHQGKMLARGRVPDVIAKTGGQDVHSAFMRLTQGAVTGGSES